MESKHSPKLAAAVAFASILQKDCSAVAASTSSKENILVNLIESDMNASK